MAPSRIALATILSASATGFSESSLSFLATSVSEIREYEMLMLRKPVLITLCRSLTIKFWVPSELKVVENFSATALNSSRSPTRTA
ncbi:hypothetical protein RHGRI_032932 [Rhododendron griersonianum]|uniref:Secreted protein n=1 Tax=Rhododendron griersonianum TaxID=479676 RepID=A0AAV6IDP8_9ERIC|nr:hypothetical protein RHGRI_032932 [Rhododendron griersonianum]